MGLVEGVTRLFKRMKRAGCEPDEITYNAVIASYKDAGREDLAAMVYQEKQFARYVSEQSKREAMAQSPSTNTLELMAQSPPTDDSES
jgi:pentatricopeptide repeat protein